MTSGRTLNGAIPMKSLTPKQAIFVDEYMVDLNATQAAIRAGYSKNTARAIGCENLSKPNITAKIANAKRERSEALKINAAWVLVQAVEVHNRCMADVRPIRNPNTSKPMLDDDGNAIYTFNAAGAVRALEIIGKHVEVEAFKDRVEISRGMSIVERLQEGRNRVRDISVRPEA